MEPGGKEIAFYSFLTTANATPSVLKYSGLPDGTSSLRPECRISVEQILWGLSGVAAATSPQDGKVERVKSSLPTIFEYPDNSTTLRDWYHIFADVQIEEGLRQCLNLTIALTFLVQSGRKGIKLTQADLDLVWALVYGALMSSSIRFEVFRSALGYHSVPLWKHEQEDNNIDELFRLHVWIPDDHEKRTPISKIHTHQAFGQGWILTGLGTDYMYNIEPADETTATHTEFDIAWDKTKTQSGNKGVLAQQSAASTMTDKGKYVQAVPRNRRTHFRGTDYTVPAGKYHKLDVGPDELHATLFFFDSRRGFQQESPALGELNSPAAGTSKPRPTTNGSTLKLPRAETTATARQLAKTVHCLRQWEDFSAQGSLHIRNAEWEKGLQALGKAENLCVALDKESHSPLKHAPRYKWAVQGEIGHAYRMIGQNKKALKHLESAVKEMKPGVQLIELMGELSVVHRHEDNLKTSRECSQKAYDIAQGILDSKSALDPGLRLKLEKEKCRAIGDLGMVHYQLSLKEKEAGQEDSGLLDLAMSQMNERIEIARRIKEDPDLPSLNDKEKIELVEYCSQREAIALARLSLCHTEKNNKAMAVQTAKEALHIQLTTQSDPTKTAFSRYFYGRALLRAGRKKEAVEQFNPENTCTPTIALCKEASEEHRGYILEMINAGADMELRDEQGYSALECAVYCGDEATERLIEAGLRRKFIEELRPTKAAYMSGQDMSFTDEAEKKLDRLRYEARIRKGYRHLVQDTLRPVLLQAKDLSALDRLRSEYANALANVNTEKTLFDTLKVVYYSDFVASGKIPKFGDGFTREISPGANDASTGVFIIFFSYRWIGRYDEAKRSASPDDDKNTQYKRMVKALNNFVRANPKVDRQKLCVWLVSPLESLHITHYLIPPLTPLSNPGLRLRRPRRRQIQSGRHRIPPAQPRAVQRDD
jgi:tetratricopeptide (TPR) repeat protein